VNLFCIFTHYHNDKTRIMNHILFSYLLTIIGFVWGIFTPKQYYQKHLINFTAKQTTAKGYVYIDELRERVLKKIKAIIIYLFLPLISYISEIGVNKIWWFNSDIDWIERTFIIVYIPFTFFHLSNIGFLVGFVKVFKLDTKVYKKDNKAEIVK